VRRGGGVAALGLVVSLLFGPAAHAQGGLLAPGYWPTEIFFERCDVEKGRAQVEQAQREVEILVAEGYSRKRILEIARTIPEECSATSFATAIRDLDPAPPPESVVSAFADGRLIWIGADFGPSYAPAMGIFMWGTRVEVGIGNLRGSG